LTQFAQQVSPAIGISLILCSILLLGPGNAGFPGGIPVARGSPGDLETEIALLSYIKVRVCARGEKKRG
jgi:hypothetical protein